MRSIVPTSAVLAAFFANLSAAMPWLEPVQTPVGLMAAAGFSPLPTEAPGLGSIPKELLRKQNQVPYPPPVNWCGFVGGNPSDVLSCSATKSCVYSGAVLGCCDAGLIQTCTNLFTTCADYTDTCNSACQANYNILKCPKARPYCGTFAFDAGTRLYNCDTTRGAARSVEFLADYYLTAIGSQVLSSFFGPISITASNQVLSSYTRRTSASARSVSGTPISNVPVQTDSPTSNAVADPNSTSHSGISTGAVIGIVVGIVIVILAILAALITWCCIRRRRQRPGPVAAPAPQMQQHQTQPQSNQPQTPTYPPQQQPTYPPQQPTYPPTQQGYFSPAASDPIKPTFNNNTSALPIPEADSTTTVPVAVAYNDSKYDHATGGPPRYSVANAGGQTPPPHLHGNPQGVGVLAPNSDVTGAGAGDYHNGYQHPPQSPTLTEVEGSSLYGQGQGQRPGLGQGLGHGYSQGSATISPLATGGTSTAGQNMGTGYGQGEGQGYGQGPGQGQGAHEADGYGRPVPGVGAGVGGQGQGQGQGQGGYGRYGEGVYEIGGGERRR